LQTTPKLGLKKPDLTDYVSIADLNENADLIDVAVGGLRDGTAVIPELQTTNKTLAGGINEVKNGLTTHLADDVRHVTSEDRVFWDAKASNLAVEKFGAQGTYTWTVPEGVTKVFVSGCGGGGSGGVKETTSAGKNGLAGGISSFGQYLSLAGGHGGLFVTANQLAPPNATTGGVTAGSIIGLPGINLLSHSNGVPSFNPSVGYGYGGYGLGYSSQTPNGGSGGESIIDYPVDVSEGEVITVTVGKGGLPVSREVNVSTTLISGAGAGGVIIIKYIR